MIWESVCEPLEKHVDLHKKDCLLPPVFLFATFQKLSREK